MPGVLPFIPLIAAGVGLAATNSQNKANQASADQHYAQAQGDTAGAGTTARSQLDALFAAHPNPINAATPIQGPRQVGGGHIGGGTLNVNGSPQGGQQGGLTPQMLQMLMQLLQKGGQQGGSQVPAQQAAPPPPAVAPPPPPVQPYVPPWMRGAVGKRAIDTGDGNGDVPFPSQGRIAF